MCKLCLLLQLIMNGCFQRLTFVHIHKSHTVISSGFELSVEIYIIILSCFCGLYYILNIILCPGIAVCSRSKVPSVLALYYLLDHTLVHLQWCFASLVPRLSPRAIIRPLTQRSNGRARVVLCIILCMYRLMLGL